VPVPILDSGLWTGIYERGWFSIEMPSPRPPKSHILLTHMHAHIKKGPSSVQIILNTIILCCRWKHRALRASMIVSSESRRCKTEPCSIQGLDRRGRTAATCHIQIDQSKGSAKSRNLGCGQYSQVNPERAKTEKTWAPKHGLR